MSIIGCYSLDLYCDNEQAHWVEGETWQKGYCNVPMFETIGRSRASCFRRARKAGWTIDPRTYKTRCPKCKGKKIIGIGELDDRKTKTI